MTSPSVTSSATFVRCSWARWMGLRVWKPATVLQPSSENPGTQLARRQPVGGKGPVVAERQHRHRPADQRGRAVQQVRDAGMRRIVGAVDRPRLLPGVAPEHVGHGDHPPHAAVAVHERALVTRLDRVGGLHGQRERQGPDRCVGQAHPRDHGTVVRLAEKAGQRARRTGGDELEVGLLARVELKRGQACGPRRQGRRVMRRDGAVHQCAAMGSYEVGRAHARSPCS